MPRIIPIPPRTVVADGIVVRRAQLVRGERLARLDDDIRRWARRRAVEMQATLETQRRDAMRRGYRDGVAAALGDVVAHLLRTEQAQRRWRGDLLAQVREWLTATSRHADTMLAVLDEVLDDFRETAADAAPDAPLTLVLPLRLKVRADAIRERVQAVCPVPLKFEYHRAGERISAHRAGVVIEYDPDDFVAHAEAALTFNTPPAPDDLHALLAPALAEEVAFFSIGTNDLTQYVMAADRLNPAVAGLNDVTHPAVMAAIEMTARAGVAAGIMVGMCGEAAGRPDLIPEFVRMGLTELSMSPASIPRAKKCISELAGKAG